MTGFERGKRCFDVLGAGAVLMIMSPVVLLVAVAVRMTMGRPVLFRQQRPGLHGQPFEMIKFRTMTDGRDDKGALLPDVDRRHPFGLWLRRTTLDELPALLNVVRGDMSLVGPRPLLMEYLPRYSADQMRRHDVKPGMTGLAQVRGRNATTWPERFASDLEYIEERSFALDARIVWATVGTILGRDGADAIEDPELGEFMGND